MAEGVPVVVTDSKGASREMVESILPDCIAAVGDYQSIAVKVSAMLRTPPDSLSIREHVRANFSLAAIADQYLELSSPRSSEVRRVNLI